MVTTVALSTIRTIASLGDDGLVRLRWPPIICQPLFSAQLVSSSLFTRHCPLWMLLVRAAGASGNRPMALPRGLRRTRGSPSASDGGIGEDCSTSDGRRRYVDDQTNRLGKPAFSPCPGS